MRKFYITVVSLIIQGVALSQTDVLIGSGTAGNTTTTYPCPLQDFNEGSRMQFLYRASELTAAGLNAGPITSIKFNVVDTTNTSGKPRIMEQMQIGIGGTTDTSLDAAMWIGTTSAVFGPIDYKVYKGINEFVFSTPFMWNGTDNIVIEICNGDPANASSYTNTYNAVVPWTTNLSFKASHTYVANNLGNLCSSTNTTNSGTMTTRPNIIFDTSFCHAPTDFVISNITSTGATLSWTPAAGSPPSYIWELRSTGAAGSGANGLINSGTTNTTDVIATGLTPVTTYNFYVRSDCGMLSSWSGAKTFRTDCGVMSSFIQNFDGVAAPAMPICWTTILRGATIASGAFIRTQSGANAYSTPNCIAMYNSNSGTNDDIILVSPALANIGAGTHRLSFYARNSSPNQQIEVGTLSDNTTAGVFTPVQLVYVSNTYSKYTIDFIGASVTDNYIGLRRSAINQSNYSYVFIDNVVWEAIPACQPVTGLTHSNITTTGAREDWSQPVNGNIPVGYHIYYSLTSKTPSDTTAPIDSVIGVTGYNMNGLLPATKYYIWVRSNCGAGDHSVWSSPDSLITACVPVSSIDENFDAVSTGSMPLCWSSVLRGPTLTNLSYVKVVGGPGYSAPNAISMYNADATLADELILVAPQLDNIGSGTYQLIFWAKASNATQDIEVGTLDNNSYSAVFTPIDTIDLSTTYTKYTVNFTGLTSDTYIGIRRTAATLVTYSSVYIDNVVWQSATTLPLSIANLKGYAHGEYNQLEWTTESERDNAGFEVQVSADGVKYSKLGYVKSAIVDGNSSFKINYIYRDTKPITTVSYYRLRQLDKAGRYSLSPTVKISRVVQDPLYKAAVYPNPATNNINFKMYAAFNDDATLMITDVAGRLLIKRQVSLSTGENNLRVGIAELLPGSYLVKLTCHHAPERMIGTVIKQ